MPKTVLVVDDSTSMRQMVAFTMKEAGFDVIEGRNGQEAISRVQGNSVNLVITDLNMPVMDGIALIKNVRSQPAMNNKPILMLTTEGLATRQAQEGKAAGASGWIVKPVDPERLLQTLARVLP
jgi:two-component system chemotaxis response regulator CheY